MDELRVSARCSQADVEGVVLLNGKPATKDQRPEIDFDNVVTIADELSGETVRINGWLWHIEVLS